MLINANKVFKSPIAVKSLEHWKGLEAVAESIFCKRRELQKVVDDIRSCSVVATKLPIPKLMGKRRVWKSCCENCI